MYVWDMNDDMHLNGDVGETEPRDINEGYEYVDGQERKGNGRQEYAELGEAHCISFTQKHFDEGTIPRLIFFSLYTARAVVVAIYRHACNRACPQSSMAHAYSREVYTCFVLRQACFAQT